MKETGGKTITAHKQERRRPYTQAHQEGQKDKNSVNRIRRTRLNEQGMAITDTLFTTEFDTLVV